MLAGLLTVTALLGMLAWSSSDTSAERSVEPRYIKLADVPSAVNAALHEPSGDVAGHVGVVVMHRTSNFLSHISAIELSRRGFTVLTVDPRSINNEALVDSSSTRST